MKYFRLNGSYKTKERLECTLVFQEYVSKNVVTGLHGQVPPTRCESVDRNGTRSRREGKGTFPMITSQATHRKENLTNLAIFPVAENGEIGKEISSFDKKQCDWRV